MLAHYCDKGMNDPIMMRLVFRVKRKPPGNPVRPAHPRCVWLAGCAHSGPWGHLARMSAQVPGSPGVAWAP